MGWQSAHVVVDTVSVPAQLNFSHISLDLINSLQNCTHSAICETKLGQLGKCLGNDFLHARKAVQRYRVDPLLCVLGSWSRNPAIAC